LFLLALRVFGQAKRFGTQSMLIENFIRLGAFAALASLVMSILIVLSQRWHGSFSHDNDLAGVQKVHTAAVPRIGGIAVVTGIVAGIWLFMHFYPDLLAPSRAFRIMQLLLVSAPAFIAGIIEDFTKKVSVKLRLSATIMSALLASFALGATVNELDVWGLDSLLLITPCAVMVTALVVAGAANAINIIDGFNGLSSSTLIAIAGGLCAVAWQNNDPFVVVLGALCIGATFGFFLLNYPFGKLFLGDGGAYFLGFWVAEMAVLLLVRRPEVNAWQVLGICAYPIIEVMFSIYRRKFVRKVSPGAPDALHLHTLVYRRVVYPFVRRDVSRSWKRNAAVACIIVPAVAGCIAVSAAVGSSPAAGVLLVCAQGMLYVFVYQRLVRGRWFPRSLQFIGNKLAPDGTETEKRWGTTTSQTKL
jgi:UDP-N-acetylmuramyl pentapeptide phosphotransferase/UDP-N-acetylglucosamine-1-phosphate transferase